MFASIPSFYIQLSSPQIVKREDCKVYGLQEAIDQVFAAPTEYLFLFWNEIPIPLSYKYDVGDHIETLLEMLSALVCSESGQWREVLASNDLCTTWAINWESDALQLTAEWGRVKGDLESIRRYCGFLSISRTSFLTEWGLLLRTLVKVLTQSGILIEQEGEFRRLVEVQDRVAQLGEKAYLY